MFYNKKNVYLCDLGSCRIKRLDFYDDLNFTRASFGDINNHE